MSEIEKIVADIQSVFSESNDPLGFLDAYDQMECLASHTGRETFLVRRKTDGMKAVAKCYDRKTFPHLPDLSLLKGLDGEGLPKYLEYYRNEDKLYVIREYIEGTPLNLRAREKQFSREEIFSIADQLCDILEKLHRHDPSVIHRDIKPQNIIIRSDGSIVLIDFDISRAVREGSEADTVLFGTKGYAPPEQYGFEQTDQRADIYAFGVLLRWLVTGNIRANSNITIDPAFQRTIDKCTAFSPDDRFANIQEVRESLHCSWTPHRTYNCALIVTLIGCVIIGFLLGRFSDILQSWPQRTPIVFTEPLIEKAVRMQLGLDESVILNEEDLSRVRVLYIYGNEAYSRPEEYYSQDLAFHTRGSIHSLNDLELLPNLERFFMAYQDEVDIAALASMNNLTYIELKHMQLRDIAPLRDLHFLQGLVLFDTGLSNVAALESCERLEELDVGYNPMITDMAAIGNYPFLKSLCLRGLTMGSLDGIESYSQLKGLTLCQAEISDLSALKNLPSLETVYITEDMADVVAEVLEGTNVQTVLMEN